MLPWNDWFFVLIWSVFAQKDLLARLAVSKGTWLNLAGLEVPAQTAKNTILEEIYSQVHRSSHCNM